VLAASLGAALLIDLLYMLLRVHAKDIGMMHIQAGTWKNEAFATKSVLYAASKCSSESLKSKAEAWHVKILISHQNIQLSISLMQTVTIFHLAKTLH
jgi:hypothetical protein